MRQALLSPRLVTRVVEDNLIIHVLVPAEPRCHKATCRAICNFVGDYFASLWLPPVLSSVAIRSRTLIRSRIKSTSLSGILFAIRDSAGVPFRHAGYFVFALLRRTYDLWQS
jgi:hypothetical protein